MTKIQSSRTSPLLGAKTAISQSELATSTQKKYQRAIELAIENDIDITNRDDLYKYASQLNNTARSHLKAALRLWTKEESLRAKGMATPENVAHVTAALYRLESIEGTIKVQKQKGKKRHRWLSQEQVEQLLESIDTNTVRGQRDIVVLSLLIGAGLRREEAGTLQWSSIVRTGSRWSLQINGKGNKNRLVPMSDTLSECLFHWKKHTPYHTDEDYILCRVSRYDKIPQTRNTGLDGSSIYRIVKSYAAVVGLKHLEPHDCRRTFGNLAHENGIPLLQIMLEMGHDSVETTTRYLNLNINYERTASDMIL